jgi:predicted nucleotidyltransferase
MKFHISLFNAINSKTKVKIIRFLINHEAFMSEREIASVLNVSHMSINRTMRELADINFADFVKIGKAHLWRVNRKSYAYKVLSGIIKGILTSKEPLEDLKKTIMSNLPRTSIKKMILFGSITKGTESASSDIDIFILVKDIKNKEKLEPLIEKLSDICFEKYGNNLAPYVLTENEMKQKKNLKIISEINGGIQIFPKN